MSTEQRQLFDTEPEPWEADDQSQQLVAAVVLSAGPAQEFDYLVPAALVAGVEVGSLVRVELNGRNVAGWITEVDAPVPAGVELLPITRLCAS